MKIKPAASDWLGSPLLLPRKQSLESVKKAVGIFKANGIKAECYDLDAKRHQAEFTDRVHKIQKAIKDSDYHLCLEVSKLKTKFYKKLWL